MKIIKRDGSEVPFDYEGIKNEVGVWVSPAFPKLIYVLDEDNMSEDAPYYYLTELAAKCSAKRMVPDYISAKVMKQLKNGDVYLDNKPWWEEIISGEYQNYYEKMYKNR